MIKIPIRPEHYQRRLVVVGNASAAQIAHVGGAINARYLFFKYSSEH